MSMNDYLWDPSDTPDPEVERLEQMLGRLRSTPPVPDLSTVGRSATAVRLTPAATYVGVRFVAPALAAAATIALMVGATWQTSRLGAAWQVASLTGEPRIGSRTLAGEGQLAMGQTLTTDAASSARVEVSTIGEVTIGSNSRVRLVETRDGHHRLSLDRGSLHAIIVAPPGQFIVDTPSATATDLGCSYTLHVDEDGSGLLSVEKGWVALESNGLESFVPAGASCRTDPTRGPGTPFYDDADEAFRDALDQFDYGRNPARRAAALRLVLDHRDVSAVTLWHLIPRVAAADRGAVVDALADQMAMPRGVTRDAILRLDRTALDSWWKELGLGDANWWRRWKRPTP